MFLYKIFSKLFALKRIDLGDKDKFTIDPQNEVKVLKSLDHPNIIKYHDTFLYNNKLCSPTILQKNKII